MSSKAFEVAIIGGGIAGLTLALSLHGRGVPFKIYEQASKFAEIGAGVSFSPNAVAAMKACHDAVFEAFEKTCTRNQWASKQNVWFDYLDGHDSSMAAAGHQESAFTITNSLGQRGVYRASFLDELIKHLPPGRAQFGKRVRDLRNMNDGKIEILFEDGTSVQADAVIGSDGIKSKVRQIMFGADAPCSRPTFTHKYAYRGLVPMPEAIKAIGEERAQNACMHMGPGGHVLTFPVNQNTTLNIVAFKTTTEEWADYQRLTRPARREDALRDFAGYGPNVLGLLGLTKPELDVWAIFDLGDHPVPTFAQGRVCLIGDAAHATSPHFGAGAGFCIEDAHVLAELLAEKSVRTRDDLETVFRVYDEGRRDRGHWLVQNSRFIGNAYEWLAEGIGNDFAKIEDAINTRGKVISEYDVVGRCADSVQQLRRELVA